MPFISSGKTQVIDSGIVFPLPGESGTVSIAGLGNIEFVFEEQGDSRVDIEPKPGGATVYVRGTAGATIGTSLKEPFDFAELEGRRVLLNLRWQYITGAGTHLIYAFYKS